MAYEKTLTAEGWVVDPVMPAAGAGIPEYTWATKPAANSVDAGTLIRITGATLLGLWESDGTFWRYLRNVPLLANGNPGTVTSGTAETVLAAILIPAGALADNGAFEAEFVVSYTNSAGNKAFQMRLGGTGITGTSLWIQNLTTTRKQAFRVGFMNRNSTGSQVQTVSEYTAGYGGTTSAILTAALDTTVDQTVYITGQCAVGTDSAVLEAIMARLV